MDDRLHAYLDGELEDPEEIGSVERLLAEQPELGRRLELARKLRTRLQNLPVERAPLGLRERVGRRLGESATPRRATGARRWVRAAGVAVALLCVMAGWLLRPSSDLRPLLLADHIKMIQAEPPGFHTTDPELLEKKLAQQLDFWPALPRWPWAELVSGRPCHVKERVVARIHYRCEQTDLSLFVLPAGAEDTAAVEDWDDRGYRLLTWHEAGLRYVLVVPSSASGVLRHFQAQRQG